MGNIIKPKIFYEVPLSSEQQQPYGSPYVQDGSPYVQDDSPYVQEDSPYVQEDSTEYSSPEEDGSEEDGSQEDGSEEDGSQESFNEDTHNFQMPYVVNIIDRIIEHNKREMRGNSDRFVSSPGEEPGSSSSSSLSIRREHSYAQQELEHATSAMLEPGSSSQSARREEPASSAMLEPVSSEPSDQREGERCDPAKRENKFKILRKKLPVHQGFSVLQRRLESYFMWPKSTKQRPQQLAEAGFFYSGTGDLVVCFDCDLQLNHWEKDDVPFEEHAKFCPEEFCPFLVLLKGEEFIRNIKESTTGPCGIPRSSGFSKHESKFEKGSEEEKEPLKGNGSDEEKKKDKRLEKEKESSLACKICYEKDIGVVFSPCGHCVACVNCAPPLENCPLCRKEIGGAMRVFF